MCTLSLYFRAFVDYPLVVAANRDEYYARPSAPPGILSDHPLIFGGRDLRAGGTWLGINQHGLLVGVLNRRPDADEDGSEKRSRGSLCLDALGARGPEEALAIVGRERGSAYRPFNLVIASAKEGFVAYNVRDAIDVIPLDPGLHVVSNSSVFDPRSEKMELAYGLFSDVARSAHENPRLFFGEGSDDRPPFLTRLQKALSSHRMPDGATDPRTAICVHSVEYGTLCSSIILLARREEHFRYYHGQGAPCRSAIEECTSLGIA